MAQSRYTYGRDAEYRLMAELREEGYEVTRGSSSKGWDLVATSAERVVFCSVKRCATWKRATTVYRAEKRRLQAMTLPSTPKIKRLLAIWSDQLGPEAAGRGGFWYCREFVEPDKEKP